MEERFGEAASLPVKATESVVSQVSFYIYILSPLSSITSVFSVNFRFSLAILFFSVLILNYYSFICF